MQIYGILNIKYGMNNHLNLSSIKDSIVHSIYLF